MKFLSKLFTTPTAREIAQGQLEDAERLALEHRAAAEHHHALAAMYQQRAVRLAAQLNSQQTSKVVA